MRVTRSDLERVAVPLLARMTTCVERAMEASELVDGVEEVVLVGGATRMPCVRDALWKVTGGIEQCVSLNPEHAVAEGAAISAALATGADPERLRDLLMLDALPRAIGLRDANGGVVVMLPRHTRLPAEHSEEFATATDDQEGVTVEVVEGEPEAGAGEVLELGSFNFPVHRPKGAQAGERRVKVTFSASEDGVVKVTGDPLGEDGEVVPPAQRDASARAKVTTAILLIYMVVLFVLYIAVKILLFQDTRLATHYGIDDAPREEL